MNIPADILARNLLRVGNPSEAWQKATREAIDAHLIGDHASRDYWRAVQGSLELIAPRPSPGDLDIYRSAKLLIAQHGTEEAWHIARNQADSGDEDLGQQATMLRIADAIQAMSPGRLEEHRTKF